MREKASTLASSQERPGNAALQNLIADAVCAAFESGAPTSSWARMVGEHLVAHAPSTGGSTLVSASTGSSSKSELDKIHWRRVALLRKVPLFRSMGEGDVRAAARALEEKNFEAGDVIVRQGEEGGNCFLIERGECSVTTLVDLKMTVLAELSIGDFFGEQALLQKSARAATVTALTAVETLRLTADFFSTLIRARERKESLLRGARRVFETMSDVQIEILAGIFERKSFEPGTDIILQGESGRLLYLLERGECVATVRTGHDPAQEVKRYLAGEVFGEKALLEDAPRAATISALGEVTALVLSRDDFERKLGPFNQLSAQHYLTDPRTLISEYYRAGDARGPAGALTAQGLTPDPRWKSLWFSVYRPCSRDSIAKMLGRAGVGKGLNVKGKSAKKNRLSGYVPFLQISSNAHKMKLTADPSYRSARAKLFYQTDHARDVAILALTKLMHAIGERLHFADGHRVIRLISDYEPDVFGLDVPQPLLQEAHITQPDISPVVGWETGRASEPAFMDMNMHAVCGSSEPEVVLYQLDISNPMNSHGLLIAYANEEVKPVVSDFDTFTVGSSGMSYEQIAPEQVELIHWSLDRTSELLAKSTKNSWTSRWLNVITKGAHDGFHPELPKFGFGDPTSYALTRSVCDATSACGAVRHGAECFNFFFPQELDNEFLVVWEGFSNPPWKYLTEPELRVFLIARARDGYCFPINPVSGASTRYPPLHEDCGV